MHRLTLIALSVLLPLPSVAAAESIAMIWGVERNCAISKDLSERLYQGSRGMLLPVVRLDGDGVGPATPAQAVTRLHASCPASVGRLVGGQAETRGNVRRVRLWVRDVPGERTLVLDRYCDRPEPECDLAAKVEQAVSFLLNEPSRGQPPTPEPTYCGASAPSAPRAPERSRKVYVAVSGLERRMREPMLTALRNDLRTAGRDMAVLEGAVEPSKVLGDDPRAKLILLKNEKDSCIAMIHDGPTQTVVPVEVKCGDGEPGKAVKQLSEGAMKVLDLCLDEACRQPQSRESLPPSPEACVPWTDSQCGGDAPAPGSSGPSIDPKTARIVKGTLWGLFAASSATAITLGALNFTSLGEQPASDQQGQPIGSRANTLAAHAWTMAGVSAVLLGVSVPVTFLIKRGERVPSARASTEQAPLIKCPN
ncbi:MAG: hypothetical protein U1A78_31045 [Polyangia bacterium]